MDCEMVEKIDVLNNVGDQYEKNNSSYMYDDQSHLLRSKYK